MAVATTQQLVSALYVAIFNRAPDKAGLDSWTAQINGGKTFASVAVGFAQHEVFTQGIGQLDNTAFVNALYTNVLGSAGDAAGVAGWVAQLAAGTSKAAVAASFVQAAMTVDIPALLAAGTLTAADAAAATIRQQTLTNKADAGIYFADTLGARSNLNANTVASSKAGLEADPIYNASKAAIANVTSTAASLQSAKDAIAVAAGTTNPAQSLLGGTIALTTAVDTITGTAASDIYNGVVDGAATSTLNAGDTINGGAGIDTLNVTITAGTSVTNDAAISNVEIINARNVGGGTAALDASTTPGLTTFVSDRSTGVVTVTNLAAGATAGVKGNASVVNGAFNAGYVAAATAANVTIDSGTKGGAIAVTGTGLTTATIASTGAANTVGTVSLSGGNTVTALTINAATNLTTGNITGFKAGTTNTLTVAGTATSVNVGTLDATIGTVTASALTAGGVTATLSSNTAIKYVGGAGNDTITSAGVLLAAGASVDAGAGTADRLVLTQAIAADTTGKASAALYKGFEELGLSGTVTQDVSIFTGSTINKLLVGGGGTVIVSNANATQAGAIQLVSDTTALTVGIKDATVNGQLDTVAITADDTTAGVAVAPITLGTLSVTGVETLKLTAVDNLVVSALGGTANLNSIVINGSGTTSLTTGAVAFGANATIDASTSTGAVVIDATGATTSLNIKGSAGNDQLTGGTQADIITGGAGNDTITGGGGADILTGGTGTNTFVFAAGNFAAASAADLITARDTITDWTAGTANKIDFGVTTLAAVAHNTAAVSGTASISSTGLASFFTSDNTLALKLDAVVSAVAGDAAGTSVTFTDSGNTYVFVSNGTTGAQAGDALIQLTGVNATTGLTFVGGDITAVA